MFHEGVLMQPGHPHCSCGGIKDSCLHPIFLFNKVNNNPHCRVDKLGKYGLWPVIKNGKLDCMFSCGCFVLTAQLTKLNWGLARMQPTHRE